LTKRSTNENWKDNLKVGSAVGLMAAAGPIAGKLAPNVNVDGKVYKMTSRVPDNIKPQKVKTDDGKEVYISARGQQLVVIVTDKQITCMFL
jgi:hypothetical protein